MFMDILGETIIVLVIAAFVCLGLVLLVNAAFFLAHAAFAALEKSRRLRQEESS